MDRNKYASVVVNSNYLKKVWMIIAIFMLASNVMLAGFIVTSRSQEKTIVVPAQFNMPFTVQGAEVSHEYIEQMARYFSNLLLTYQKSNVAAQFDTVLRYADPSVYGALKARFALDADRISKNDISSVFYLMDLHIKKDVAIITGELNSFIGSHLVSKQTKNYELIFKYNSGLSIIGFNELKKGASGELEVIKPDDVMMIDMEDSSGEQITNKAMSDE